MKRRWLGLLLALDLSGAAAADWTLGPDGFGPLRIGMRFAQAQRAAGPALQPGDPALLPTRGCEELPLPGHPGVSLMFIDGVLRRIDLFGAGVRTDGGIGPGDPVSDVERVYPVLARMPDFYDGNELYLTVGPAQGRAMRFVTQKGKVAQVYAGEWAQVQYVEGCL
jgi:hypothetical protein